MRVTANIVARANGVWAVMVVMVLSATILALGGEKDLSERLISATLVLITLVMAASLATGRKMTLH